MVGTMNMIMLYSFLRLTIVTKKLQNGNMIQFRCRISQAQILDVIYHVLLRQHHSELCEVIRHKKR